MVGRLVCDAFGVEPTQTQQIRPVAESALAKRYVVHALAFDRNGRVHSKDRSTLDPDDEDETISGWGGLTELSSRFGDAVRRAVNEHDKP